MSIVILPHIARKRAMNLRIRKLARLFGLSPTACALAMLQAEKRGVVSALRYILRVAFAPVRYGRLARAGKAVSR
jgi:hypothetical protein